MKNRIKSFLVAIAMIAGSILPIATPITSMAAETYLYSTVYGGATLVKIGLSDEMYTIAKADPSKVVWSMRGRADSNPANPITERIKYPAPDSSVGGFYTQYGYEWGFDDSTKSVMLHIPEYREYDTTDARWATDEWRLTETPAANEKNYYIYVAVDGVDSGNKASLDIVPETDFSKTVAITPVRDSVGTKVYARELEIKIGGSGISGRTYQNFGSLQFWDGSKTSDYITLTKGTKTHQVLETVTNNMYSVQLTGVDDATAPKITSLVIEDGKANVWATQKTIAVTATDENLATNAYYWETSPTVAAAIKERIIAGATADEIGGMAWGNTTKYTVTSNGAYTVFVRDKAGNIGYGDITVFKISTSTPNISSVTLGKANGTAYFDVKATDEDNQPLMYKLNEGGWVKESRLTGVIEGENTIYVKNEAGSEAYTSKNVYLSVYLNNDADLSAENLYNFIQISPSTWTNGGVNVSLILPDTLLPKLATAAFSVNGGAYTANRTAVATQPDELVYFTVKDSYGGMHTAKPYKVTNIDKTNPALTLNVSEKGVITATAQDMDSGIKLITISSNAMKNYIMHQEVAAGISNVSAQYTPTANGSFSVTATDFAGNTTTATINVTQIVTEITTTPVDTTKTTKPTSTYTPRTTSGLGSKTGSLRYVPQSSDTTSGQTVVSRKDPNRDTFIGEDGKEYYVDDGSEVPEDIVMDIFEGTTSAYTDDGDKDMRLAQKISIIRSDAALENGPIVPMEVLTFENPATHKLKTALLMLPLSIIAGAGVFLIASGKLTKLKIFRKFRR